MLLPAPATAHPKQDNVNCQRELLQHPLLAICTWSWSPRMGYGHTRLTYFFSLEKSSPKSSTASFRVCRGAG